ncbi:MAG: hypothetical protein Q8K51_13365 [Nitrospirota bacterium]|jgi:cytochrome b subunit of formate dehydrogenase|nr:hypothetical protein [Nitrospirota bacterium]
MMEEEKKKSILAVLNNFLHDIATGLWLASFFLGFEINRRWGGHNLSFNLITEIQKILFTIWLIALLIIILTGIVRRKTYTTYLYGVEIETRRKTVLIIKHILFGFLSLGGVYFFIKWL